MVYVKNTGRYALAYTYMKGAKEEKVVFDRQRFFRDTGNVATTGVTEISEEAFEALKKDNKVFAEALKDGTLVLTEAVVTVESADAEIEKLKAEKAALEKKLNKDNTAKELKKVEEEKAKLEKENADMKAKLEALAKAGNDSEGF